MKLVSVEEMRAIEQAADAAGQSYGAMMDMAGQAVAMLAQRLVLSHEESEVLVLVGPGNNGGDGLVVARYLLEMDQHVTVYVWKRDIKGDENFRVLKRKRRGIAILWADNDAGFAKLREEARRADLIVDALLGTGAARPIEGTLAEMLLALHEVVTARRTTVAEDDGLFSMGVPRFPMMEAFTFGGSEPGDTGDWGDDEPFGDEEDADSEDWLEPGPERLPWPQPTLLAVDCATGLNCDTGAVDPATLPADLTVTFGFPKWGHVQFPGAGMSGLLAVADIGVPPQLATSLTTELLEPALVRRWLPARPPDAHKGTFGKVMVAAGSLDYTGAALLSATAAICAGAGLVTLAIPGPLHAALAGSVPEATWVVLPGPEGTHTAEGGLQLVNRLGGYDALLVGPGLTEPRCGGGFRAGIVRPRRSRPGAVDGARRGGCRCVEHSCDDGRRELAESSATAEHSDAASRRDGPTDGTGHARAQCAAHRDGATLGRNVGACGAAQGALHGDRRARRPHGGAALCAANTGYSWQR